MIFWLIWLIARPHKSLVFSMRLIIGFTNTHTHIFAAGLWPDICVYMKYIPRVWPEEICSVGQRLTNGILLPWHAAELGLNIFVITFPRRVINFVSPWLASLRSVRLIPSVLSAQPPRIFLFPPHCFVLCWHFALYAAYFCASRVECLRSFSSD